jgi:hypothetical protein
MTVWTRLERCRFALTGKRVVLTFAHAILHVCNGGRIRGRLAAGWQVRKLLIARTASKLCWPVAITGRRIETFG